MHTIAPDVARLNLLASNAYLVGEKKSWVVVDSGMPGFFSKIKTTAEEIYGADNKPKAIILTHGHVDHYGSALALAAYWDVPIYAHPLDLPYLTGRDSQPPLDPTVGGFFAQIARFLPSSATDLGHYVKPLPDDNSVPGLPGWRWIHTPGHTAGHVSLFRDEDKTLVAGDAVVTVNMDKFSTMATMHQEFYKPPTPGTYDWIATRKSIKALASLRPSVVASGHGVPMTGPDVAEKLEQWGQDFIAPLHGRYVPEAARFNLEGVEYLPPPVPDPLPTTVAFVLAGALIGAGVYSIVAAKNRSNDAGSTS